MGFEMHIDKAIRNSKYLAEQIKKKDGFELLIEPEYTNCCFWYYPACLRELSTPDPSRLTKVLLYCNCMFLHKSFIIYHPSS